MSLMHCGVTVEVNGRPIHVDKTVKEIGVQVVESGKLGPHVRVIGFKRELRYTKETVLQLAESRIAEGKLAIVGRDKTRVLLSKGQPSQLEMIVRCLKGKLVSGAATGGTRPGHPVFPPSKKQRLEGPTASGTPARTSGLKVPSQTPTPGAHAAPTPAPIPEAPPAEQWASLASLPVHLVDQLFTFEPPDAISLARLSETSKLMAEYVMERRQSALRLAASRGAGIPVDRVVHAIERRPVLTDLDLSGFAELAPAAAVRIAEHVGRGRRLQVLRLRGCRLMTDTSIRKLLTACPELRTLDLLEIPRLSNLCLKAHLPKLSLLAVGTLGPQVMAEKLNASAPRIQTVSARGAGVVSTAPQQKSVGTCAFTAALLAAYSTPDAGGIKSRPASGVAPPPPVRSLPLTHLVLANCPQLGTVPSVPDRLQLLDLRGCGLVGPGADIQTWAPLAACACLEVLCLAANPDLGSATLVALLSGMHPEARLKVLDISGTRSDLLLFRHLAGFASCSKLSHLRVAGCQRLNNQALGMVLTGLRASLEVVDVAGCRALEAPFGGVAPRMPKLRVLAAGQTDLAMQAIDTRRALRVVAPDAEMVTGSWDIFKSYSTLPPTLL